MELMVVEDDAAIRNLIVHVLQGADYAVTTARDGLEALDALDRKRPDAILLDVNMPRMDGFSFLEALRSRPAASSVPVLMLTAQSSAADIRRAMQLGARDYIGKPFEARQLLRRVQRLLAA